MEITYNPALYLDVRQFIEDHVDLIEEDEYDVLTAKVFESWLITKIVELGYVFFVGPPRSGKTRALEIMEALCYNSKMAAYMSTSTIYRLLDMGYATLFLDEIQQYLTETRMEFLALLNAGQRKGARAWLLVQMKEEWIPTPFKVFSSKFLASTRDTAESLATRCIIIAMMKNVRTVPLRIDRPRAEALASRLNRYANSVQDMELPDLEALFLELGFKDYRNIEAFINLAAVTPPEYRTHIIAYAKAADDQIAEEEGVTQYADIYAAIEYAWSSATGGKVSINAIAEAYNDGRQEQEILSNRAIGGAVNVMGLRQKCRMTGGRVGRYISERTLNRLRRRYRYGQATLDEPDEAPEGGHTPPDASLTSLPSLPQQDTGEGDEHSEDSEAVQVVCPGPEDQLFQDAREFLEVNDGSMLQRDFFGCLTGLGYNQQQASKLLRTDARLAFRGLTVTLMRSEEP